MTTAPRFASLERKTRETDIKVKLILDGSRRIHIRTGLGLFNHTLELIAFWAGFDLDLICAGDLDIDAHHSMEDTGLALGEAINAALGDKRGIQRVGDGRVPMDEALTQVDIDLSGRPWLVWRGAELLPATLMGEEIDVWREFYKSLAFAGRFSLHINFEYGQNGHHLLESVAKGLGCALKRAIKIEGDEIRSSKGVLN